MTGAPTAMDDIDRRIVVATQGGLPLTPRPYHAVADMLGLDASVVMERMQNMVERGVIRRIGAVPNHYALGYRSNGMTVWDVPDERVAEVGRRVGALPFVSHCYHRPRRPDWPYTLFAMVHARDREAMNRLVDDIAAAIGPDARSHQVLVSTRVLKKTGLRLGA